LSLRAGEPFRARRFSVNHCAKILFHLNRGVLEFEEGSCQARGVAIEAGLRMIRYCVAQDGPRLREVALKELSLRCRIASHDEMAHHFAQRSNVVFRFVNRMPARESMRQEKIPQLHEGIVEHALQSVGPGVERDFGPARAYEQQFVLLAHCIRPGAGGALRQRLLGA